MDVLAKIQPVGFGDDILQVVESDGEGFVVVYRVSELLELKPQGQQVKLSSKHWAWTQMICVHDTTGRKQDVFCLHVSNVAMWLATIDENRVAEHVRPKLRRYQKECAAVLHDHFMGAPAPVAPVVNLAAEVEARMLRKENRLAAKLVAELSRHPDLGERPRAALAIRAAEMVMPGHDLTPLLPVVEIEFFAITRVAELLSEVSGVNITPQRVGICRKAARVVGNIDGISEVRLSKSKYSDKQVEQTFVTAKGASMIARQLCADGHITAYIYAQACEAYDWPELPLLELVEMN